MLEPTIKPYEYSYITQQVTTLVSAYLTLNDQRMRQITLATTLERIIPLLPDQDPLAREFLQGLQALPPKRQAALDLLQTLQPLVIPFAQLTPKQLSKLFRKVKKLPQPNWAALNLHELTYLGWNDGGNQKKYLVAPWEDRLIGIQGDFAPQTVKGVCAICHTIGNVSLFTAITKRNGVTGYTRQGNYICRDSAQCNRQLTDPQRLQDFLTVVRPSKSR
ncbi:FusB/FusC family EF-G-binding protein [Levilactobacillus namurensis]|uniref:FusB/FusC family EF-G-binding protein n=1 Tax=Levilactobacillus namurensis TaxID=380393 RepID=UPI001DF159E3|nr:FusB/FusC family EF-G-binding protein [Levilactobacillus namurensis]HJE45784.1 FusB/FusC family EF-G-binding protein [Levilactobacillus namurensis]